MGLQVRLGQSCRMWAGIVLLENSDVGVLLHERDHVRLQDLVDVATSCDVAINDHQRCPIIAGYPCPHHDTGNRKAILLPDTALCITFSTMTPHMLPTIQMIQTETALI